MNLNNLKRAGIKYLKKLTDIVSIEIEMIGVGHSCQLITTYY